MWRIPTRLAVLSSSLCRATKTDVAHGLAQLILIHAIFIGSMVAQHIEALWEGWIVKQQRLKLDKTNQPSRCLNAHV